MIWLHGFSPDKPHCLPVLLSYFLLPLACVTPCAEFSLLKFIPLLRTLFLCVSLISSFFKIPQESTLVSVAQLVGALSCKLEVPVQFWSGPMPRLWVKSLVGDVYRATNWCFAHALLFLSLSLPLSFPLSKISKYILGWGSKKKIPLESLPKSLRLS